MSEGVASTYSAVQDYGSHSPGFSATMVLLVGASQLGRQRSGAQHGN